MILSAGSGDNWMFGCSQWWVLAGVALIIGCVGIVAVSIVRARGTVQPDDVSCVEICAPLWQILFDDRFDFYLLPFLNCGNTGK